MTARLRSRNLGRCRETGTASSEKLRCLVALLSNKPLQRTHRWILFITSFIMFGMTKRLQAIGNSSGIIIDRAILDLLGITQETDLDLETDGKRLIITPLQGDDRRKRLAKVQSRALRNHAETFRKLAK